MLGAVAGGLSLLWAYGLDPFGFPAIAWRDHPFDYANIRFMLESFSLDTRLWGYDPLHLFGWTPNVFYNPLASLLAGVFVGIGGGSEGAYRIWLLVLLLSTSLVFLAWLPRTAGRAARVAGGWFAATLSLVVYPTDVGLLDANPVQVIYTGQWAQRLGIAFGLLAVERFFRALVTVDSDLPGAVRKALAAAALLGASLFCHFISGYAAAAVLGLITLQHLAVNRQSGRGGVLRPLLLFPAVLAAMLLLFADFFAVFLSVNQSHHGLPLLQWVVPAGALATVRDVLPPSLPVLLLPLVVHLARRGPGGRAGLARALFPLVVLACFQLATPATMLLLFIVVLAAGLASSKLEDTFSARHVLPVSAFFLMLLACGPESLRPGGLDLSGLVPWHASLGWAKLAGFSRFLLLAWLGVLVAGSWRDLRNAGALARCAPAALGLVGLALPLTLSLTAPAGAGAQTFFGWMMHTDQERVERLTEFMEDVARVTPVDGYLLVEDTLHHPKGSELAGRNLPHGHLPYLVGPATGRPVLGGAVTTRLLTHPLAHTSRGQLLCRDFGEIQRRPDEVLDRLRTLGVSDLLVHSPGLKQVLEAKPGATLRDAAEGMVHFSLGHHRPILTDEEGTGIPGAQLRFARSGLELELPPGTNRARLRQVWYPFLECEAHDPRGTVPCELTAWSKGPVSFANCLVEDTREISVEIPWIQIGLQAAGDRRITVKLTSAPGAIPFVVMSAGWIAALGFLFVSRRRSTRRDAG